MRNVELLNSAFGNMNICIACISKCIKINKVFWLDEMYGTFVKIL